MLPMSARARAAYKLWGALALAAAVGLPSGAFAQDAAAPKGKPFRVEFQKVDVAGSYKEASGRYVEFPAGFKSPPGFHAGEVVLYVLSGDLTLNNKGQPPAQYKAGQSVTIGRGVVHDFSTANGATFVAFWVVDKGIPLDLNP